MEQRHFVTTNSGEIGEVSPGTPAASGSEQRPDAVTQVERLARSVELQLPATFSYEAYIRLRDDERYVISDDLRPALQETYQLSVVQDHEAARQRSIETIDALLARANEARVRFDNLIDGARRMPEYASELVLDMARGGESERGANDQVISVLQVIADLLEAQRDDIRTLKHAGLEIERAMDELKVSSQFLAACIVQAKTPRPMSVRNERAQVTTPLMPSSPPHIPVESIDQLEASVGGGKDEGDGLNWDGPVINLDKVRRTRSSKVKGDK